MERMTSRSAGALLTLGLLVALSASASALSPSQMANFNCAIDEIKILFTVGGTNFVGCSIFLSESYWTSPDTVTLDCSAYYTKATRYSDGRQTCLNEDEITVRQDPIITGFDGKTFHFHETGDFSLLAEPSGWKVEATFVPAAVQEGDIMPERLTWSWTSAVRVVAPNGDMVSCSLPWIRPNTSHIAMSAVPAAPDAQETVLSADIPTIQIGDMKATAVLSDGEDGSKRHIARCEVDTPSLKLSIVQVSGWDQAFRIGHHKSVQYYTWLDTELKVTAPLATPVTGLIGATYPQNNAIITRAVELTADKAPDGLTGGTTGTEPTTAAQAAAQRRLSFTDSSFTWPADGLVAHTGLFI